MRIRTRLLQLVLAVLIPSIIASGLGIAYIYFEEKDAHRAAFRETTRALALVLDTEIAKRESVLRALAQSPLLDRGEYEAFYALAKRIAGDWNGVIVLSDPQGQQFLNTRAPYGEKKLPIVSSSALRQTAGADATVVSNLYMAPLGKIHSFSVQVPVKRNDQALFYISMGTPVDQLQSVFDKQRLPERWIASILDRNGIIIARNRDADNFIGRRAGEQIYQKIMTSTEGFNEGPTLSGEMVNAFFSRAPGSAWTFIVSVPISEISGNARRAVIYIAGSSLILLGLAVFAAFAVARRTARSIEDLRESAEKLGRSEPIQMLPHGIAEMDAVQAAMIQAGDKIRNARTELEQRVAEAVAATEQSEKALQQAQKLEALGQLTGGIAHDFNNVLQTLNTGLQVIHYSAPDAKMKSVAEACQRAVGRAAELTRQMMAFGRVQDARLETVDVSQQLFAMQPLLQGGVRSDIDLRLALDEALYPVTLDPLQFELAMLNLVINARDAMPNGGTLQIEACNTTLAEATGDLQAGRYVQLSVIDSGEGMSEDVLAKALDPFFTTKSIGKGSGMGLSQAYGFARQSGGTLQLHSKPGVGTAALIYLPKASDLIKTAASPTPAPLGGAWPALGGVVLFVEDDTLVRDVVGPALAAAGFEVILAFDADEAISLLSENNRIDLVFSDIVMPGKLSGIDLANAVGNLYPHIPVVLASGYSERRVAMPGIRMLPKPYNLAEVIATLNDELQARRT